MNWRDITSWSRGEKKGEPQTWEAKAGGMDLVVTRHIYYPGEWVMSVYPKLPETQALKARDVEGAKREAVEFLRRALQRAIDDLGPSGGAA